MRKSRAALAIVCLAGAFGIHSATVGDAAAQIIERDRPFITRERPPHGPPKSGIVVAHSRWGHGSISGPVRPARNGWEVRLPRGTWVPCKRSCSEELRLATVDLWETQGDGGGVDGGPGYFRFNFWF